MIFPRTSFLSKQDMYSRNSAGDRSAHHLHSIIPRCHCPHIRWERISSCPLVPIWLPSEGRSAKARGFVAWAGRWITQPGVMFSRGPAYVINDAVAAVDFPGEGRLEGDRSQFLPSFNLGCISTSMNVAKWMRTQETLTRALACRSSILWKDDSYVK